MPQQLGELPPHMHVPLPGSASVKLLDRLARAESPAFTSRRKRRQEQSGAAHDPIVWVEARGANVVDADGNILVDLTSGFGAAAIGHAHPKVVSAVQTQASRLVHALGDVHPSDTKIRLLDRLAALAPWPSARVALSLSGADAVETALKTAVLATGRPGVVAFEGSYHGLSHGPLAACGFDARFREPFARQLNPEVTFAPYPTGTMDESMAALTEAWPAQPPGAVLVEPVLGRGGVVLPPAGFLAALADFAHSKGSLVVVDEILTGLGRCGSTWRSTAEGARPDLLCVGKALGGGFPISACLGRADVMASWGAPGEGALHTGTFFGHPVCCAAALAALDVIEDEGLADRAATIGARLLGQLDGLRTHAEVRDVRGCGLLLGVEFTSGARSLRVARALLENGYLVLSAGRDGQVLQLLPPLTIDTQLMDGFVSALEGALGVT